MPEMVAVIVRCCAILALSPAMAVKVNLTDRRVEAFVASSLVQIQTDLGQLSTANVDAVNREILLGLVGAAGLFSFGAAVWLCLQDTRHHRLLETQELEPSSSPRSPSLPVRRTDRQTD
eukprot:TRINITY_DN100355_c0_g1_i1.p1 TRINITY_DN100355_c0_g1~~TRINITY_DN100355_c0_g1_i1.p1  ORF type:complete len:119 (+),score=7.03 TRINITY_DN100355_c0_g1_i1:32-388(+)